jgi:hypothetical protein
MLSILISFPVFSFTGFWRPAYKSFLLLVNVTQTTGNHVTYGAAILSNQ